MILTCEMTRKELFSESTQILNSYFNSETVENLEGTDESAVYDRSIQTIEERIQNFNQRGSNWRFQRVLSLDIHFTDFQPLRGSTFLPLPSKISTKKAVINMKNNDDQCFKWSVVRALNPVDIHPERITKELKDQSERLDWSGLKFPVDLKQIRIFEKLNPQISINVFGFEGDVYPLRLSKSESEQTINLLLISDEEKQHYCLIKRLSRLLSSQMSKHGHTNSFCLNCLNHFPNEEKLKIHEEYCLKNQAIRIEMPEEGSFISFIHHNRSIKVPFVVYADFEAFTEEIPISEQNEKFSFTQKYQKHKPSGFCYKIVCFDERYNQKPVLFRARSEDEDVSAIFVEMLERDIKRIQEKFDFSKKMIFSLKDKDDFEKARVCWICQKEFGSEKKVRDHCHFTGKYRGATHAKCNLQFKQPKFTPVIFHNLSGYDAHLFVKNLGKSEGNIKCIPNNEEKYISFSKDIVVGEYVNKKGEKVEVKHEIRFLDSFKFMASSLESLVGNLGLEKLIQTKKEFGERVELLSRKGIYYMSTEIYLKSKLSNKNGLSKTRNNLIGHTIFLTSEKYRMTNHRPHTKFFTSEKIVSGFPSFRRSLHSECSQLSLPLNHGFKVCRHCFSQTIYRRPSKRKHKKENSTECCVAEGISEAEERVKTYRRNSPKGAECTHRRIYHYGTKERQQRRL